jgi:hypothetical protein
MENRLNSLREEPEHIRRWQNEGQRVCLIAIQSWDSGITAYEILSSQVEVNIIEWQFCDNVKNGVNREERRISPMNTPDVSFSTNDYTRAFNQTLIMITNYSTRTIYWHITRYSVLFFKTFPIGQFNQFAKSFYFPPLRYLSQG